MTRQRGLETKRGQAIGKGNQMTALRLETRGANQSSLASLRKHARERRKKEQLLRAQLTDTCQKIEIK